MFSFFAFLSLKKTVRVVFSVSVFSMFIIRVGGSKNFAHILGSLNKLGDVVIKGSSSPKAVSLSAPLFQCEVERVYIKCHLTSVFRNSKNR